MTTNIREATREDVPALAALIGRSVRQLQRDDYSQEQLEHALATVYGVDTTLIDDGTYYVVEAGGEIAACGGWSKRETLCGGDQWTQRDDTLLDPLTGAARIRAFYVDPERARRGLGTLLLDACETAARAAGFHRFEMAATLTGEHLYAARGYVALDRTSIPLSCDDGLIVVRMVKEDAAGRPRP